ncbi:MAG: biotin/lipoyl-containing protein [Marinilabilia sp.]
MKKYLITVNEKQYEVEVEEIKTASSGAFQNLKSAPKLKSGVSPNQIKDAKPKSSPKGGNQVTAPMPGSVVKVNVSAGDKVEKGQTLLVFEAMKMENDLTAPIEGTVLEVNASEGTSIAAGEVLVVIE